MSTTIKKEFVLIFKLLFRRSQPSAGTGGRLPPSASGAGYPLRYRCRGPMYLGHGFRQPNFVPKFGASVMGIGPYKGRGSPQMPPSILGTPAWGQSPPASPHSTVRSAAVAPRKSIRTAGSTSTWWPIFPAETQMLSKSTTVSWKTVGKGFFMPTGLQPPWT